MRKATSTLLLSAALFVMAGTVVFGQVQSQYAMGYVFAPTPATLLVTTPQIIIQTVALTDSCGKINDWDYSVDLNQGSISGSYITDDWSTVFSGQVVGPITIDFRARKMSPGSYRVSVVPTGIGKTVCQSAQKFLYFDLYRLSNIHTEEWATIPMIAPSGLWLDGTNYVISPNLLTSVGGDQVFYGLFQIGDQGEIMNFNLDQLDSYGALLGNGHQVFDPGRPIFVLTVDASLGASGAMLAAGAQGLDTY